MCSSKSSLICSGQNLFDITRRWTPGFKQNVWASRVNTTTGLATAIKKAKEKPDVFISLSGVGTADNNCSLYSVIVLIH